MKKKLSQEKGSMAVYVTIVLLSFLILVSGVYALSISNRKIQAKSIIEIKKTYEMYNDKKDQVYNKLSKSYQPPAGTTVTKPGNWISTEVTPIADGNGGTVPLPKGFHYVGGDYNTGLVISDKENDTMDASGVDMGNQFVWIPVSREADLERTDFDANGDPVTGLSSSYIEPDTNGYPTENTEYNTMKTQVIKYGGFYIGRFEAGVNSTELRTVATEAQTVVCKKGVAPYNWVPWGKAMNDASEISGESGAVYLANNMYAESNSVISTLIYGCQWDAMCRYIEDSQRTTSTKSAPQLTGSVADDMSKNIYDLSGNCREWTMESYSSKCRSLRGGYYSGAHTINYRNNNGTVYKTNYYSFRVTLYVK